MQPQHPEAPTGPSSRRPLHSAVLAVSDQVEYLHDTHQAYEALEKLVTPVSAHEGDRLEVPRGQLGSLLRVLNRGMREQIAKTQGLACTATCSAREVM